MSEIPMTKEFLGKIYDILVKHAGAYEEERESFVFSINRTPRIREWRFIGALGMGGKIWFNSEEAPFVNCYAEDISNEIMIMIKETNKRLYNLIKGESDVE